MSYTVKSSEKTRKSGADGETKALLYLMNFHDDSDDIHYFVVDFFNDLTGMDRFTTKLWDVQSKSAKNNSPKAIGRELVTLFKNYISEFDFTHYILFCGGVTENFRTDDKLNTFGIGNITSKTKAGIICGLKEESLSKGYINDEDITENNLDGFLAKVLFVIDDKKPIEYVKAIIKNHPGIIPEDRILEAIFNEIRDAQSSKKNSMVEGVVIQATDEVLNYCRHLTNNEVRLLTLQRILNRNPIEKSIPISFISLYNTWSPEKQKEMIDECKQSLCCALFNKNAANAFWTIFESIYTIIVNNPCFGIQDVYQAIDNNIKNASPNFDALSLKYFIATVKDGIQDDN